MLHLSFSPPRTDVVQREGRTARLPWRIALVATPMVEGDLEAVKTELEKERVNVWSLGLPPPCRGCTIIYENFSRRLISQPPVFKSRSTSINPFSLPSHHLANTPIAFVSSYLSLYRTLSLFPAPFSLRLVVSRRFAPSYHPPPGSWLPFREETTCFICANSCFFLILEAGSGMGGLAEEMFWRRQRPGAPGESPSVDEDSRLCEKWTVAISYTRGR